ncbi:hypothetical protein [Coleofasciculus sp. H7-2]
MGFRQLIHHEQEGGKGTLWRRRRTENFIRVHQDVVECETAASGAALSH